ncbi:MAG: hypothetical protein OXK21_02125 [Chloroflexota bacterium]|nr:hypothetical protein [Chloroflexota bacterium]
MADIVLGVATSRSPMTSLPPEMWPELGERDKLSTRIKDRYGVPTNYEELLAKAPASVVGHLTPEVMTAKHARVVQHTQTLVDTIAEARPDVLVIMGDDEDENIWGDNRPAIMIYWGDSYHLIPRAVPPGANEMTRLAAWAWGKEEGDHPTAGPLGRHLVERLIEAEFDIASADMQKPGEGMAHGFGFVLDRLTPGASIPFVPVILNVHTPPNQPTPKRLYDFGKALREALLSWPGDERVAVVATGGLSVGIVDEELDRLALAGMAERDMDKLAALPRTWMQGSQGEVLCWMATAGASDHLDMELLEYIPGYRSPAGTGCGLAFARWR